jgi:predicted amidohydrolase
MERENSEFQTIGRPVNVTSLSFSNLGLDEVLDLINREVAPGTDLVLLPESWMGMENPEPLDGPTLHAMSSVARHHTTYLLCTLPRQEKERIYTSMVLLDRQGHVAGYYDKYFPYWDELRLEPPVNPGKDVPVWKVDFGRLGAAICFDMNFPEVWQSLGEKKAEIVAWSSAVSGGLSLQSHAIQNHYYIITANLVRDCSVYDISGELLLYEKSQKENTSRIQLDLDRGIFHYNFNLDKLEALMNDHNNALTVDRWFPEEEWFVLKAIVPGVSARQLAAHYGLEELPDYIRRSRQHINQLRTHAQSKG